MGNIVFKKLSSNIHFPQWQNSANTPLLQFKRVSSCTIFRGNGEEFPFLNNRWSDMSSFLKELKWVSLKFSLPMNCLVFCENVSFYFWLKFWQSKEHKIFQEKNKFLFDNSKINKWNKKITIFPQKMFTLKWQNISFIVHFTIGCN